MGAKDNRRRVRERGERYDRQGGKCCYCQGQMMRQTAVPAVPYMVTNEHIHQKVIGGRDYALNLLAACHGCNKARPQGMSPSAYAMLRILLLRAWPALTYAPDCVKDTLTRLHIGEAPPRKVSRSGTFPAEGV